MFPKHDFLNVLRTVPVSSVRVISRMTMTALGPLSKDARLPIVLQEGPVFIDMIDNRNR